MMCEFNNNNVSVLTTVRLNLMCWWLH